MLTLRFGLDGGDPQTRVGDRAAAAAGRSEIVGSRSYAACTSCGSSRRCCTLQQRSRRPCPWRSAQALGPRRRVHCPPSATTAPSASSSRYYEDVLDRPARSTCCDRFVGPEFIGHDSGGAMMDRDGYITAVQMLHDGFDATHVTIEDQVAEGDRVTTRWSAVARHTGSSPGSRRPAARSCSPAPTSTASTATGSPSCGSSSTSRA